MGNRHQAGDTRLVELSIGSKDRHYNQVLTGFAMLARQGSIRLRQSMGGLGVLARVDGRRIYYDVTDGAAVNDEALANCDLYFKRSYFAPYLTELPQRHKVTPLGLYYSVNPDFVDWRAVPRNLHFATNVREVAVAVARPMARGIRGFMSASKLQALPTPKDPKVLFLCKAFETWNENACGWQTRRELTEFRAECIKALRSAFGRDCIAGFIPSDQAKRDYPSLVADVRTDRPGYIELLRNFPSICVTTTGLHGSIGGKLAEYVAFSKAVVTEALNFEVPGFHENTHYLRFSTPDECVALCQQLARDETACMRMRNANRLYFETYLRPDKLVERTLDFESIASVAGQATRSASTNRDLDNSRHPSMFPRRSS